MSPLRDLVDDLGPAVAFYLPQPRLLIVTDSAGSRRAELLTVFHRPKPLLVDGA